MLPAATRPSNRARSTSMCSRPLSSGTTTPSATALGSTRSIASSSAGAFTVTSSRSTGFASCSTTSTRARQRPLGRLDDETGKRDQADGLGVRDADDLDARVREPDGERASDGAGAEDCRSVVHAFAGSTTRFTTFEIGIHVERLDPCLPPTRPRVLDAAEAHVRLGAVRPGVDDDDARLHALGEEHRTVHARRVDRRREAVRRVVDELDRLVEARRRGRGRSPARRARCARSAHPGPTPSTTVGATYQPGRSRRARRREPSRRPPAR